MNNILTFAKKQSKISPYLALVAVAFLGIFLFGIKFKTSSPEGFAAMILEKCRSSPYRPYCYDQEIIRLTETLSLEDAFSVITHIQERDNSFWFCHETAHNLSEKEYEKDPSQWKEVISRCPIGMCSNGCIHGATQRHFSSAALNNVQIAELMPDLQTICERRSNRNPTPLEEASCYHEIGHLSLYLSGVNILQSKAICDVVAVRKDGKNYLQTCYEGIFMQVFEPRDPDDFALIYDLIPLKEKLISCDRLLPGVEKGACWKIGWEGGKEIDFCNGFEGDLRYACFREAWVVHDEAIQTSEGIVHYCSYAEDKKEKRKCYNHLYYALMAVFDFDEKRMEQICSNLPQELQGQCFANTASRLVETDSQLIARALAVCNFAASLGIGEECYDELSHYAGFAFHRGSPEFWRLCNGLPEPWQAKCAEGKSN